MYQRTFFATMSLLLSLPMLTQQGYAAQATSAVGLTSKVEQAVIQQVHPPCYVEWAKAVKQEEHKANHNSRLRQSTYGRLRTVSYTQHPVPAAEAELYKMRTAMLQNLLDEHAVLNGYMFRATVPEMLTGLEVQEFGYLFSFFQESVEEDKASLGYDLSFSVPQRYVVELRITGYYNNVFILRINTVEKKVYFFLNEIKNRT